MEGVDDVRVELSKCLAQASCCVEPVRGGAGVAGINTFHIETCGKEFRELESRSGDVEDTA